MKTVNITIQFSFIFPPQSCCLHVSLQGLRRSQGPYVGIHIPLANHLTDNVSSSNSFVYRSDCKSPTVTTSETQQRMDAERRAVSVKTLRTGDADLRFLTRWNSVHLQVLLSATPQGRMFPEVSHPQALLGSLVSISWKFQFTKIVGEFVINF